MRRQTRSRRYLCVAYGLALFGPLCGSAGPVPRSRELDQILGRTVDPAHGARLYETCAACHGAQGEGLGDGSVPMIAGQPFAVIAKQLVDFRSGVRIDSRMQHFADTTHLSYSQEVADVASYVSQLRPRVPDSQGTNATGGRAALLYIRRCERCHGTMAEGNGDGLAPRLAGQRSEYIARQLSDKGALRPSLKDAHIGIAGSLSPEDVVALAATLSTL